MPSNKGDNYKVSHIVENPVNVICEQLRYRSDWAFAQSDQHLCCSPSDCNTPISPTLLNAVTQLVVED